MKTRDNSDSRSGPQKSAVAKPRRKTRNASTPDSTNGSGSEEPPAQRALLNALTALKCGDFGVRLPLDWAGFDGKIASAFNEVVAMNERTAGELARLRQEIGDTK